MPAVRLSMRKIFERLCLACECRFAVRVISEGMAVPHSSAGNDLSCIRACGPFGRSHSTGSARTWRCSSISAACSASCPCSSCTRVCRGRPATHHNDTPRTVHTLRRALRSVSPEAREEIHNYRVEPPSLGAIDSVRLQESNVGEWG